MNNLNGQRDGNGRFAAGNRGGPGRPSRATELDYLIAVSVAVPPERLRRIAERAAAAAEQGDAKACRWLSDILVGRRANTSLTLTVTEEGGSIDFRGFTNEEFAIFSDLYGRIRSGEELSADDAQVYVRFMAKSLASAGRTEGMFDGGGDD
jgi:hypothetical protein